MVVKNSSGAITRCSVATAVRRALRGSVSVTVGTCLLVAASSQAAESNASAESVEEVIVTGIRHSLESAQQIKQETEEIVDSVTAQDIGALPDRSVSEALQRIPGVTLQRTNANRDPARLAAEGGGVFVRGLSWVRSETNGRDVFSANNGRGLSFEDVSADLLAGVDVYKNPSAEQIEGGIGGIVNLRTRLPFDSDQQLIAASIDYNYADLREEGFVSGNGLFSNQWSVGDGRLGVLLSASFGNVGNRTDSIQTGRFEPRTLSSEIDGRPAGSTVYVPVSMGWRRIDWEQERTAYNAALQYAPNDEVTVTVQALRAQSEPEDIEYALGGYETWNFDPNPSMRFDDQDTVVEGTIPIFQQAANTRYGKQKNTTSDYSLNVKWVPNNRWAFSGDFQYIDSSADIESMTAFTQPGAAAPGSLDFNLRGDTPWMQANAPAEADQSAYWWAAAMDHIEDNEANEYAVRADAEYTFEDSSFLRSFRMGIRGTDKEAITRQTGWNWGFLSRQYWGGTGNNPPVILGTDGFATYVNDNGTPDPGDDYTVQGRSAPGLANASSLFTYGNFFRGDVNMPGVAWFPTRDLVSGGRQRAYDMLSATQSAGWGWTALTDESYEAARPGGDNPNGGVNTQSETTSAAYAMLRFGMDDSPLGRFDGNIGVRVVRTEVEATGLLTIPALENTMPLDQCVAANGAAACADLANAVAFTAGGNVPGYTQFNDYTDVLPTLNVRFFLTDELQLRFAAGQAMVRPSFSQMMPYNTLSFTFESDGFTLREATGTGGNPELKPTRANQFDASVEWYFAPTGSATLALFYKDIKDYIFLGQDDETYTSNGVTQTFDVQRNTNGDNGTIRGFEIAYQQFYDQLPSFLSGLGLQANFTYVDSEGGKNTAINTLDPAQVEGAGDEELPLEGLSETSYNVALLYEKYGVSARLAYNWREKYLLTTSAANINRPVWFEDYGQLDGSVFYSITSNVKIGIQGTNLLNSRSFLDVGGAVLQPRYSWTDTDRRIAVALRASF